MSSREGVRAREARREIVHALSMLPTFDSRIGRPWTSHPWAIADVMSWTPVVIAPDVPAWMAERLAAREGVHHLPVVDRGTLVGVACTCDLRHARSTTLVAECMSAPVFITDETRTIRQGLRAMQELGIGCLPVVAAGRLIGIITRGDLHRAGILTVRPSCQTCGSHHHVRGYFCVECLEDVKPPPFPEHYLEIGGGD